MPPSGDTRHHEYIIADAGLRQNAPTSATVTVAHFFPARSSRSGWGPLVRDYRVLYEIHEDVVTVLVLKIGHRRDVYR